MEVPVSALVLALVAVILLLAVVLTPRLTARRAARRRVAAATALAGQFMAARRGFAPGMSMHSNAVLNRLETERKRCIEFIDNLLAQVESEGRDLVPAEQSNLSAQRERVKQLDEQIKPLREWEDLRSADDEGVSPYVDPSQRGDRGEQRGGDTGHRGADRGQRGGGLGTQVNDRVHEYRSAGEFIVDGIFAAQRGNVGTREQIDAAATRLRSNGVTFESGQMIRAAAPHNTTTEVPGLLPESIVGAIMSDVDAARPFIQSVGAQDLGSIPGTTFNRPTITEHVNVGKQTAEKAELEDGQFKVGAVPFAKDTYGGWANVSRQLIDWTSPAAWNALLTDFIEQYGLETENAAADAFVAAIVQEQELTTALSGQPTLQEVLRALYGAAKKSYQGSGRMPDAIWASLDWWETLGVIVDHLKATTNGDGGGDSSVQSFAGNLLRTPRIIVPSFPDGTLIVGVRNRTEVYEDRLGFLSVVEPKVLGVQLAYGGYMASGTIKPAAFTKIVNEA
jgi:hypothetical protein